MKRKSLRVLFVVVMALVLLISVFVVSQAQGNAPKANLTDYTSFPATSGDMVIVSNPAAPTIGGPVYYNSRALFDTDYPGLPVETLEAGLWGAGQILGCPAPFNATTNNACFTPGNILPGISFQDNPLNAAGGGAPEGLAGVGSGVFGSTSKNIVANTFVDSIEIAFSPPINAAGMDLVHYLNNAATVNITIFDASNVQIAATSATASNAGLFWGVYSDVPIGRINILSTLSSGDGAEGVDNVAFGAVVVGTPEIVLTKTVGTDPGSCATTSSISVGYGSPVYYCYTVQNTGNITLTHHTVTDDVLGTVLGPGAAYDLAPGATYAFTETYVVMTDTIINNALWTAYISGTNVVATATGSATVTGTPTDVTLTGLVGQTSGATLFLVLGVMATGLAAAAFYLRRQWQS